MSILCVCVLETNKLICGLPNLLMLFSPFQLSLIFVLFSDYNRQNQRKLCTNLNYFIKYLIRGSDISFTKNAIYCGLLSSTQHRKPDVGFIFGGGDSTTK